MDVTWLPYYHITHLTALTEYFDLLGVKTISKLAKGTEAPPQNDPQMYVRVISKTEIVPGLSTLSRWTNPPKPHCHPFQPANFSSTSTKACTRPKPYNMPPICSSSLCSINHLSFTWVSPTIYHIKQPNYPIQLSIHVAQIAEYIQFNKQIHE